MQVIPFPTASQLRSAPVSNAHPGRKAATNSDEDSWPYVRVKGGHKVTVYRNEARPGYVRYQIAWYKDGKMVRESAMDAEKAKERARSLVKSLAEGQVD